MIYWHIIFPRIEQDILTKKRTVLHLPSLCNILVGDYLVIHSDAQPSDSTVAIVFIKSIKSVKLKDISKESILKMNIDSHQDYFARLYETYQEDNLTPDSDIFEIEFEYGDDLSKTDNKYFTEEYQTLLTRQATLLQSPNKTDTNNTNQIN
jgi:hypothetical protein